MGLLLFIAFLVWLPSEVKAPKNLPFQELEGTLILIQGNSLSCEANRAIIWDIKKELEETITKYPELADLLICMWEKESSYGKFLIGDNRKAVGHFQIWISKHPVSYECAMDFECSLDYTAKMIKEGKGNLWTTYKGCLTEYPELYNIK